MKGHKEPLGKNKWKLVLELGKGPDGRRVRSTPIFYGTGRQADAEIVKLLHKIETGTYADPSRMTVAEYLLHWLDAYAKTTVSERTFERYQGIVHNHLIPGLGKHRLSKLRPLHIQAYYSEALEGGRVQRPRKPKPKPKGKPRPKDGQEREEPPRLTKLSPQTVKHHHRVLSEALRWAVRWHMLAVNPAEAVQPPRPQPKEIRALDAKGAAALLASLEGSELHLPALIALTTGMRLGEILGLRWADVDLSSGKIAVRQNLQQTSAGLLFKTPKTAKGQRSIPLPDCTVTALKEHAGVQADEMAAVGEGYDDHDLVICGKDGSPLVPARFSARWRDAVTKRGGVRFHDLRHSHATLLLSTGTHAKIVSERLGHATVGITLDTYSHVLPDLQDQAARSIDALLGSSLTGTKEAGQ